MGSTAQGDAITGEIDVSFVIPVHNSRNWLDECLGSLLSQTGARLELICVDDGSIDDSPQIVEEYSQRDARVRLIRQSNLGQSVARNAGTQAARGRYLAFVDSDDFWLLDCLGALVEQADAERLDVLQFDGAAFRHGDVDRRVWKWYSRYYRRAQLYPGVYRGPELMALMSQSNDYRPHVGLYLARTSFVRSIQMRFIEGIVHQDNPYTFRLLLASTRSAHRAETVYARRIRPKSTITALDAETSVRGYGRAYVEMQETLRHLAPPLETERRAAAEIVAGIGRAVERLKPTPE